MSHPMKDAAHAGSNPPSPATANWRAIPGFDGLYEMNRAGQVRSRLVEGGQPRIVRGIEISGVGRVYDLRRGRRKGAGRGKRAEVVRCAERELLDITFWSRRRGVKLAADADISKVNPHDISEIRWKWSVRELRRYPRVTVEILVDTYRLTSAQVRAIIAMGAKGSP